MGVQARLKRERQQERAEARWEPFRRATPTISAEKRAATVADILRISQERGLGITEAEANAQVDGALRQEMWQNNVYTVVVVRDAGDESFPVVHLSIRRTDRQRPGPDRWRDFQRIKNELVGEECEAVELYPAEERVVDTADQYHLYVVNDPSYRFPFGFRTGLKVDDGGAATQTAREGTRHGNG